MNKPKNDPAQHIRVEEVQEWLDEVDVLVVGLGAAGACAALEAHYIGADVAVIEAASGGGGTSAMSGGQIYLGGGTALQTACGFEDDPAEMEAYLKLAAGPGVDAEKLHAYCSDSALHYDWLVEQGVEFNPEFYAGKHTNTPEYQSLSYSGNEKGYFESQAAKPAPRSHKPKAFWEDGGSTLMATLLAKLQQESIEVMLETRALKLIVDGAQVVGVLCRQNQKVVGIKATAGVVLCTGGFIMNRELVARHAPDLLCNEPLGNPNDTGDGIQMGAGVGGATQDMHSGFQSLLWYPDGKFCEGVFVNALGARFVNEDCYHSRAAFRSLQQPEGKVYLVVDSEIYTKPPMYSNASVVEVGESFQELETDAGFVAGSLTHTMQVYNAHAADGEDPYFHKSSGFLRPLDKPPFALLDFTMGSGAYSPGFTFGGLVTNLDGRVLRTSGEPIAGLFAAGRATRGLPGTSEGYASGMSIGDATYFGRRAGRAAASSD